MKIAIAALAICLAGAVSANPLAPETIARAPATGLGLSLSAGGGVNQFTASETNADVGGMWDVRLTAGTRQYVAAEAAYVGTRRNLNLAGISEGAATPVIQSHAIEGNLRGQYPYALSRDVLLTPFIFGGAAWWHYGAENTIVSGLLNKTSNDLFVIPAGAGVGATISNFVVEARFTYRFNFNEDMILKADRTPAKLDNWGVGGTIGYEF